MTLDLTLFAWFLAACILPAMGVLLAGFMRFRRSQTRNRRLYGLSCLVTLGALGIGMGSAALFVAGGSGPSLFWIVMALVSFVSTLAALVFWLIVRMLCQTNVGPTVYRDTAAAMPVAKDRAGSATRGKTPVFVSVRSAREQNTSAAE